MIAVAMHRHNAAASRTIARAITMRNATNVVQARIMISAYVVDDWRGHHLSAPPRGYHWVQTGSDYVLVAIATGVILQLLLSH